MLTSDPNDYWTSLIALGILIGVLSLIISIGNSSNKKRKEQALITKREVRYIAYLEELEQRLAEMVRAGQQVIRLTAIDPEPHDYKPMAGEHLLAALPDVSRVDQGPDETSHVTAAGKLLVTNKALVFQSGPHVERLAWAQIPVLEMVADGWRVDRRTGAPIRYVFNEPCAEFAAKLWVQYSSV